jgi:protein gp37
MGMTPFAVTLISAADGDTWKRTLPEWKHLHSPDHQYTLHRLSNEEKKDLKVTESNEVYVHWSGWFVPTGIFVNSMEEFVEFKVNKKYDTKVIKV